MKSYKIIFITQKPRFEISPPSTLTGSSQPLKMITYIFLTFYNLYGPKNDPRQKSRNVVFFRKSTVFFIQNESGSFLLRKEYLTRALRRSGHSDSGVWNQLRPWLTTLVEQPQQKPRQCPLRNQSFVSSYA
jgi:hypothetical protein